MEFDGASLVKGAALVGVGGALVYAGTRASREVAKAELCDEIGLVIQDVILVKDATYAPSGELSNRERSAALHHLEGIHDRLRESKSRNKPSPQKTAERADGVLTKYVAKPVGNLVGWLFGSKDDKKEVKPEEEETEVEIKTPQQPATSS